MGPDRANYHDYLDKLFMSLHLPIECLNCTDYCCTDYSHIASIQYIHDYIEESCLEASKVISVSKKILGWNEHVEPHKQKSQFWHLIWKECGSRRNGEIAQIMKTTFSDIIMLLDMSRKIMKLCVRKLWHNLFQKITLEIYGKKSIK